MLVQFFSADRRIPVRNRTRLKKFIETIFLKEKQKLAHLNYIFCSDEYLLDINRSYLKHDYYTDIITFDLSADPEVISGEVYISIDRVNDNASDLGIPVYREMHRVIFHGCLHLCGYRDKSAAEESEMRKKEDLYLSLYFK